MITKNTGTRASKRAKLGLAGAGALMLSMSPAAAQPSNVMFILDASNSMWAQIDGTPKIEIAKDVLAGLVSQMPADTRMGLIAYGHRFDRKLNECDDMELVASMGHFSKTIAPGVLNYVTPKGQTPIAATLLESQNWLEPEIGQDTTIVLISDGVESCDGDPCAAAKTLNDAGISTKIHVVGFDLTSEQRKQLECISTNGNGRYFEAKNAGGLAQALEEVRQEVAAPAPVVVVEKAPEPVAVPASRTVFEDNFDSGGLADGWEVLNPNEDQYVSEAGELLIVALPPAKGLHDNDMENVITHPQALPDGDWAINVKFKADMKHGEEAFYFGAMDDHEGWLAAGIRPHMVYAATYLEAFIAKFENGKLSRFDTAIDKYVDNGSGLSTERWANTGFGAKYAATDFYLTLRKEGRSYNLSGTYKIDGQSSSTQFKTEELKMLRGKKKLFLAFGIAYDDSSHQGEGSIVIDKIKVTQ